MSVASVTNMRYGPWLKKMCSNCAKLSVVGLNVGIISKCKVLLEIVCNFVDIVLQIILDLIRLSEE